MYSLMYYISGAKISIVRTVMRIWQLKNETPKLTHNYLWSKLKNGCFSINIRNSKNDGSLFSLKNNNKNAEVCFWNFSVDSLDIGSTLENWENNT